MIVVLDDDVKRHAQFSRHLIGHPTKHVSTAAEAVEAIERYQPRLVFLDYDLDLNGTPTEVSGTGADVAAHLVERADDLADRVQVVVHSLNPLAGLAMVDALNTAGYRVAHKPFAWEDQRALDYFAERAGA